MNIFNSLGSNYSLNFALKSILSFGGNTKHLKFLLEEKYKGKVVLLYKGREAIELALKQLTFPIGSYIAICGFTCFAVYEAIKNAGFEVEYLDLEKGELNFSAEILEKALDKNPKIKVVIIQNTLGYPCDIKNIAKVCKNNNLTLIEDLAHSVGTKYENGIEAGTIGNITILSFSQDKIIDGISGGALVNKNNIDVKLSNLPIKKQLLDKLYPIFTFIIRNTYPFFAGRIIHKFLKNLRLLSGPMDKTGNNMHKLPNWYCNLIVNSFDNLSKNLEHRKKIANIYRETLNPKILSSKIVNYINQSTNLRFPIFITNRITLINYLKQFGVYISDIWYDAPIGPKKYLSQTNYRNQCPNAELASSAILNLPTHENISETNAKEISNYINQWLKLQ